MTYDWEMKNDDLWVGTPYNGLRRVAGRNQTPTLVLWRFWYVNHMPGKRFWTSSGAMRASDRLKEVDDFKAHTERAALFARKSPIARALDENAEQPCGDPSCSVCSARVGSVREPL